MKTLLLFFAKFAPQGQEVSELFSVVIWHQSTLFLILRSLPLANLLQRVASSADQKSLEATVLAKQNVRVCPEAVIREDLDLVTL